jgi:hypothetical protein
MALHMPQVSTSLRHTLSERTRIALTGYIVLLWFLLVLSGSVAGTFAQFPLVFYLTVGGPVVLQGFAPATHLRI